jgi:DeoR/GlpR family transcriptional regulator of sugar metabolism
MKRNLEALVSHSVLKGGTKRVGELAEELGVSEVTIRKTLSALERRGVIRRYHGEARAFDGDDIPFRMEVHYDEKVRIARKASEFVERGDTILVEAGSTVAILVEMIKGVKDLSVITPNLFIARLFRGTKVRVVVLGGLYQEESESFVGPLVRQALDNTSFSKAFLGVSGFDASTGFTSNDFHRAEIHQAILNKGATNFVITDSTKFGAQHAARITNDPSLVHWVITDSNIPLADEEILLSHGTKVIKV